MPDSARIAVAQWCPILGRIQPNLEQLAASVEQAAAGNANLLVTPELGLTGYLLRDLTPEIALPIDDPILRNVAELSRRLPLMAGFVERGEDGQCYNAAGYWAEGKLVHVHRKIYLPTYGLFDEGRFFARGDTVRTFPTPLGPLAILICEDLWHPSTAMLATAQGAVGLLVSSAAPGRGISDQSTELASRRTWKDLVRLFGKLLGCWVAWSNRTGFEDGIYFTGGSLIISPESEAPLVEADHFASGTWIADVDLTEIGRARVGSGVLREEDLEITHRQLGSILEGRLPGDPHRQ
jgi:predicted amidohydrolase